MSRFQYVPDEVSKNLKNSALRSHTRYKEYDKRRPTLRNMRMIHTLSCSSYAKTKLMVHFLLVYYTAHLYYFSQQNKQTFIKCISKYSYHSEPTGVCAIFSVARGSMQTANYLQLLHELTSRPIVITQLTASASSFPFLHFFRTPWKTHATPRPRPLVTTTSPARGRPLGLTESSSCCICGPAPFRIERESAPLLSLKSAPTEFASPSTYQPQCIISYTTFSLH